MRRKWQLRRLFPRRLRESTLNMAAVALMILLIVFIWNAAAGRGVRVSPADAAALRAPTESVLALADMAESAELDFAEVLAVYLLDNGFFQKAAAPMEARALETRYIGGHKSLLRRIGAKTVNAYADWLRVPLTEITCFPVQGKGYMYADSYGASMKSGVYTGIDIYDTERTPGRLRVAAIARGAVTETGRNQADGWYAVIQSANGTVYRYAHLAYLSADVTAGAEMAAGATLGYMGDTGTDGRNELFPVRLTVTVTAAADIFPVPQAVNPYIFLRLVETGGGL